MQPERAELFCLRLEIVPSNAAVLHGMVDGAGIKLRLNW